MNKALIILLSITTLMSCTVKNKIFQQDKLSVKNATELIDSLLAKKPVYNNLKCKANATVLINQNKENSAKLNFRITKDSLIWANFSKSGVQILTTILAKDSIKFLKKITKKEYFFGDYIELEKIAGTPINYTMIQDLIEGEPIMFDLETKYYSSIDLNQHLLSSVKPKKLEKLLNFNREIEEEIIYRYWITPENYKCSKIEINDLENKRTIVAKYSNWKSFENGLFPLKAKLSIIKNMDTIRVELDFNPNYKFDSRLSFPFKYTSNYSPINLPVND